MRKTVFSMMASSATSWFNWDASMTEIQFSPSETPTRKRCGALLVVDGLKRLMPARPFADTWQCPWGTREGWREGIARKARFSLIAVAWLVHGIRLCH